MKYEIRVLENRKKSKSFTINSALSLEELSKKAQRSLENCDTPAESKAEPRKEVSQ